MDFTKVNVFSSVLNVDFSQPFMTGGITTLVKNPEPNIRTVEDLIANGNM